MCVCFLWEMLSFYKVLITSLHLISPTAFFIMYWVLVWFFCLLLLLYFGLISFLPVCFAYNFAVKAFQRSLQ